MNNEKKKKNEFLHSQLSSNFEIKAQKYNINILNAECFNGMMEIKKDLEKENQEK